MNGSRLEPTEAQLDHVFGALSDPTRRRMLSTLIAEGSTSVPRLTAELPISRQAIAKHLSALGEAGLIERAPGSGREVHYRLRPDSLRPAAAWIAAADTAWAKRLGRLKAVVEEGAGQALRER